MKLFSSGEVAAMLGIHRDKIHSEIKAGATRPSIRLGNRMAFTRGDVEGLFAWCRERGIEVTEPVFDASPPACKTTFV